MSVALFFSIPNTVHICSRIVRNITSEETYRQKKCAKYKNNPLLGFHAIQKLAA
jgi:hypothetical protein